MGIRELERERQSIQALIDQGKNKLERNRLGQFATPQNLAREIVFSAIELLENTKAIHFLEPSIGSGSFYSAMLEVFGMECIEKALGFEIDLEFVEAACRLWEKHGLIIQHGDFTKMNPPKEGDRFNLLIANPPYVRHHHLAEEAKNRLSVLVKRNLGMQISKLSGLYCYFMLLSHAWLCENGLCIWLVPSEFLDVNYGMTIKKYLLEQVDLIRVHCFDPDEGQFSDALVSSSIVWYRKRKNPISHNIEFSFGGSIHAPNKSVSVNTQEISHKDKWSRIPIDGLRKKPIEGELLLGELFTIKRGIATGGNDFFILSSDEIEKQNLPLELFRPILPSSKKLKVDSVEADASGNPILDEKLFVFDSRLSLEEIKRLHPGPIVNYLERGLKRGVHQGYICRNRNPWYAQEKRDSPLLICNYIGRENGTRAFRFIWNKSNALFTNSYLGLYAKPCVKAHMHQADFVKTLLDYLNNLDTAQLIVEGRVYGGGMYKLEPKELAKVRLPALDCMGLGIERERQLPLFGEGWI
jgi:adenine-specific DNA-methyltransferase